MRISDLVKKENVYVDLESTGREDVLKEMVERLHGNGCGLGAAHGRLCRSGHALWIGLHSVLPGNPPGP